VMTPNQLKHLREGNDIDFSYVSAEGGRFRVNVFRKETGIGAAFRAIPTQMPSMEQLALPPIVRKLCDYHQGMILVTGATGTGKSTTLASMIDYLNSWKTRSNSFTAARAARSSSASWEPICRPSPRACARPCARIPT
jgi:twitching motility protein PilT